MSSDPAGFPHAAPGGVGLSFSLPTSVSVWIAQSLIQALGQLSFQSRWSLACWLARRSLLHNEVLRELLTTNLSACLSELTATQRNQLKRRNAEETMFALLDRFRLWSLPEAQLREQVQLVNGEILHSFVRRQPVVLLCPHFLGLEAAAQRLSLEVSAMTLYRPCRSAAFESIRAAARQRFGVQHLFEVGGSLLPMIRRLRAGTPLFLLPDLDDGSESAVFSTFFGVSASTAPLTAWCAHRLGAVVLPISVVRESQGRYTVTVHEPMQPPSGDLLQDTHRVNAVVETLVREQPDQYWWAQPRFATRPVGAQPMYGPAVLQHAREAFGSAA